MERVKKIIYINKKSLLIELAVILGMGTFGSLLHELIMFLDKTDMEQKVFPMGAFLAIMGLFAYALFLAWPDGVSTFQYSISMGDTRKNYLVEQIGFRVVENLLGVLLTALIYLLELWKFDCFYPGFSMEIDLAGFFSVSAMLLIILFSTVVQIIIIAAILKFGSKAYAVLSLLFAVGVIVIGRVAAWLAGKGIDIWNVMISKGAMMKGLVLLVSVIGLWIAGRSISGQSVNN